MIWLGVDGGGTKTAFCLVDDEGTVLAESLAPSSYYFSEGIDVVRGVLGDGIAAACNDAGIAPADIDFAFFGLPGYGESSVDIDMLDQLPAPLLGHDRYACGNDMICGWAGSLGAVDGVNVIAGTGSMTYGERHGRGVRVGGWGEVFGDEGSAYWLGCHGLRIASQMSDGRLARGPLLDLLVNHLHLPAELDLVDVVLNRWRGDRSQVAGLARIVTEAAAAGDADAGNLLVAAGHELARLVATTRTRLEWPEAESMPVSWSGGVFSAEPVRDAFRTALDDAPGRHELCEPALSPVFGAALYAAKLADHPLAVGARDKLRAHSGAV